MYFEDETKEYKMNNISSNANYKFQIEYQTQFGTRGYESVNITTPPIVYISTS